MKKYLVLIALALLVISLPAMAGKLVELPVVHPTITVYQAQGVSELEGLAPYAGYTDATIDGTVCAVPGILDICPGTNWANFIDPAATPYKPFPKNVTLTKQFGTTGQCSDVFPTGEITPQQGTPNIRLWWPLMYEVPGTVITLSITYGTMLSFNGAYVHEEIWSWTVGATLETMEDELALFHELPDGLNEVPLISDENLYPVLQGYLECADAYFESGDLYDAGNALTDFELAVSDAYIGTSPAQPWPELGQGIIENDCNPAWCKLLVDAGFVGQQDLIFQPSK